MKSVLDDKNEGRLTFIMNVFNLNMDMTLEEFGKMLHDIIDEKINKQVEKHTKDQKYLYDFGTRVKTPKGEKNI